MVEGSSVSMQRILLTCCVAVLGCSTTLHAQQPEPTDARAFLEQHAVYQNSSKATRAAEEATLARARLYLHAGAENELRQEVAKLTESHPVGLRYAMLADCWRPGSYRKVWSVRRNGCRSSQSARWPNNRLCLVCKHSLPPKSSNEAFSWSGVQQLPGCRSCRLRR